MFLESAFESVPIAALQLYVLLLEFNDNTYYGWDFALKIASLVVSILSVGHGVVTMLISRITELGDDLEVSILARAKVSTNFSFSKFC